MDPDTALMNMRTALRDFRAALDAGESVSDALACASELADAVEALDGWLMKGGFPPKGWRQ